MLANKVIKCFPGGQILACQGQDILAHPLGQQGHVIGQLDASLALGKGGVEMPLRFAQLRNGRDPHVALQALDPALQLVADLDGRQSATC